MAALGTRKSKDIPFSPYLNDLFFLHGKLCNCSILLSKIVPAVIAYQSWELCTCLLLLHFCSSCIGSTCPLCMSFGILPNKICDADH